MKTTRLIIALLMFHCYAWEGHTQVSWSFKLSPSVTNLSYKPERKPSPSEVYYTEFTQNNAAPAFESGIQIDFSRPQKSGIKAEFLYMPVISQRKYRFDYFVPNDRDYGIYDGTYTLQLSYISIPVYYQWKLKSLSFYMGIQYSRLVDARAKTVFNSPFGVQTVKYDNNTLYQQLLRDDYGLRGGMSWAFTKRLSVTGAVYLGLMNISPSPREKSKISSASLGLSYRFFSGSIKWNPHVKIKLFDIEKSEGN